MIAVEITVCCGSHYRNLNGSAACAISRTGTTQPPTAGGGRLMPTPSRHTTQWNHLCSAHTRITNHATTFSAGRSYSYTIVLLTLVGTRNNCPSIYKTQAHISPNIEHVSVSTNWKSAPRPALLRGTNGPTGIDSSPCRYGAQQPAAQMART